MTTLIGCACGGVLEALFALIMTGGLAAVPALISRIRHYFGGN